MDLSKLDEKRRHRLLILKLLLQSAAAMQGELTADGFEAWVDDLQAYKLEQIAIGLGRMRREVERWPQTIKPLLDRMGVVEGQQAEDAEALLAWDRALQYAKDWMHTNVHGSHEFQETRGVGKCYEIQREGGTLPPGWTEEYRKQVFTKPRYAGLQSIRWQRFIDRPRTPEGWHPEPRIQGTVRVLGGWGVLHTATEENVPFVKKDFIAAWKLWRPMQTFNISPTLQLPGADRTVDQTLRKLGKGFPEEPQ